jgi:hypothetical protein
MQSQQTFEKESKTLHGVTLDLTRGIWPDLLYLLTLLATIYFVARPESFVVTVPSWYVANNWLSSYSGLHRTVG